MKVLLFRFCSLPFFFCALFFLAPPSSRAQAPPSSGSIRGQVTDPSGATVPDAAILIITPQGAAQSATTNREGIFEAKGLSPGKYGVKVIAPGFAVFERSDVELAAGHVVQLNITLAIEVQKEKVEVNDTNTRVDVNPANNAGAIVLQGKDLEALSDDPDEMQAELQALAGPSAGPNGGQIYIDGFTGGQLPPKESIREIRINQNPFSAEFDKLGYGRIEIFTKPGTDQLHGRLFISGNTSAFNSRSPFENLPTGTQPPGYESTQFSASLGGPLSKKASYFFDLERRDIHDLSIVSARTVDPTTFQVAPFSAAIANPHTRLELSPRLDYQISPGNTLMARYQYWRNSEDNGGVGGFNLASLATNSLSEEHTLQLTDTQTLSATTINETRFQFIRSSSNNQPVATAPTVSVQQAFTSGGSSGGFSHDTQNRYEFQNITYMTFGKHSTKFGGRLRATAANSSSNARFNGAYSFTTLAGYQTTLMGIANGETFAQIQAQGGGAAFYSLNFNPSGSASAGVTWLDGALFLQDDWRIRPNMTFSYGLRYETQNNLGDHADFAPRLGFAWGLDGNGKNKPPKTVLRLGYGIFYDRFTEDLVLQQQLHNGVIQQQFIVQNPAFFDPVNTVLPSNPLFPPSSSAPQTIYRTNPNLRTPYILQTGLSLERQLTKSANLSVTYLNSRGLHQFYTSFTNANSPGLPPPSPILYQYQSAGIFKENQLIINSSIRMGTKLSLFGYYALSYANSDTSGAGSIPSDPSNILEDYGRASFDVRNRLFLGGFIGLPKGFRVAPFMIASSGSPFNITTGQDLFGNAVFNSRPAFGDCSGTIPSGTKQTPLGCFNLTPAAGQPLIPINLGTGPGRFTLNLRLSKTFGFGQKKEPQNTGGPGGPGNVTFGQPNRHGGGGGRGGRGGMFGGPANARYNLTFSVTARNVFNNVNLGTPIGNLSSPLFGESNSIVGGPFGSGSANRRIDLQLMFTF